ncbi:MAG: sensor domain-containing diguanylate cyclase [Bacillota bacterium]
MKLSGNEYRLIVENSPNMVWRSGLDAMCDYFNLTWLEFTGRTMEQEVGSGWAEGVHPDDYDECLKTYLDAFAKRERFEMMYRLRRFDGEWRWINDRGVPVFEDDVFRGYIGSCMDITEKIDGEKWKLRAQADGLTGISNRQYFEQRAREEFAKARRFGRELCVIMVDIDDLKAINDNFGHQAGDAAIVAVAELLRNNIRTFDLLGRYGGDEFIIMLPDTNEDGAALLMERLSGLAGQLQCPEAAGGFYFTFSCGSSCMRPCDTFDSLVFRADKEMYESKNRAKEFGP